jgi:signal transduction histidine kinase/ActR/RegA family two-component response regulator
MRLADFMLANVEPILKEWEVFARGIWPDTSAGGTDPATLRDHAKAILLATVPDMKSAQTKAQQSRKSKGADDTGHHGDVVDAASEQHGADRVASGFDLAALVSEYRALRASVLRLWHESTPTADLRAIEDVTRFNEAIDQSLAEAVDSFTRQVDQHRAALETEHAARAASDSLNRTKDEFLAVLSHELRTPLTAIVLWVAMLRRATPSEKVLAEGLDAIDRSTQTQVRLIEDVLDVSRIVSGKLDLDLRQCELIEIVKDSVDAVRPVAAARGITLDVQLNRSADRVAVDAMRMQQVVGNLLTNALKFTPTGGRVGVALTSGPSEVRIEVNDTGEGIDAAVMPYIFDRFRQADSSTRRKAGGLGLGLSIVKHLVEAHGGTVEARSDGRGKGATFTVRLPTQVGCDANPCGDQVHRAAEQAKEATLPLVRLDRLRVLVVEDEAEAREIIAMLLTQAGAIVTVACSAADALQKLPTANPEVLVSDLGLPDQDGFDLIRQVRALGHQARDLPAVALTAFVQKDDQRRAILAGFQVHVPKPVDPHDLTLVIASLAGRTGATVGQ